MTNEETVALITKLFEKQNEKIDDKFEAFEQKIDAKMDERFEAFGKEVDAKFEAFGKEVDAKFEAFEEKMDVKFEEQFCKSEDMVRDLLEHSLDEVTMPALNEISVKLDDLDNSINVIKAEQSNVKLVMKNFEFRLSSLEKRRKIANSSRA